MSDTRTPNSTARVDENLHAEINTDPTYTTGRGTQSYSFTQLVGLILGPALFALFMLIPEIPGMSSEAKAVLAGTMWVACWWMTEAVPIPVTSLLPLVLFPLTGAMDGKDVASAYGNDIAFMFLGGFVLAIAMEKWNLHQRISLSIVSLIGTSPRRIILGFMVSTGFLSMWVSNTAATMMMVPVGLAVASQAAASLRTSEFASDIPRFEKSLIFGVGYGATVGGLGTLIGTPPLAILAAASSEIFGQQISFASWMAVGVPVAIIMMGLLWVYLTMIKYPIRFKELPGGSALIKTKLRDLGKMTGPEKTVLVVFVVTAFFWITRTFIWKGIFPGISDGLIAVVATVILFLLPVKADGHKRIVDWEDSKAIPWDILLLFGGGLAIAAGFVSTGLTEWIGEQLRGLEGMNFILIMILSAGLVLFLTEITSNTATATMIMPIMASFAVALSIHPYALMVPCAMAANLAFMLPVGTPPNAIIFGTKKVSIREMAYTGVWLNFISLVIMALATLFILPLVWGIDLNTLPEVFAK